MRSELLKYAPLPVRLMVAVGFLVHGLPKFTGEGHGMFQGMLTGIGVPAPGLLSWVTPAVEVGAALLILAGAHTSLAAAALLPVMLVALVTVHLPSGFSFMNVTGMADQGPTFGMPGAEISLIYIAMLLTLVLGGSGPLSVDSRRAEAAQPVA